MAETTEKRTKVIGYGYMLVNTEGVILHYTFRRTRRECWADALQGTEKKAWMKDGWRATLVFVHRSQRPWQRRARGVRG